MLDRLHAAASAPPFWRHSSTEMSGEPAIGPDTAARQVLPLLVSGHWVKLRRKVRKAGSVPSDRQLHRIRILSKQLRYASEAADPVVGKPARRTARRAEALQAILGDRVRDSVTAVAWLEQLPPHATPSASFSAGAKTADKRHRQAELRHGWERTWSTLQTPGVTRWLE